MENEIITYLKGGKVLSHAEIDERAKNYVGNLKHKK